MPCDSIRCRLTWMVKSDSKGRQLTSSCYVIHVLLRYHNINVIKLWLELHTPGLEHISESTLSTPSPHSFTSSILPSPPLNDTNTTTFLSIAFPTLLLWPRPFDTSIGEYSDTVLCVSSYNFILTPNADTLVDFCIHIATKRTTHLI